MFKIKKGHGTSNMATVRKCNNSYQIRVSSGYDNNGKQRIYTKTWRPDPGMTDKQVKKEVNRIVVNFEQEVRNGLVYSGGIKFYEFTEKWMAEYANPHLKPNTVEQYKNLLVRIQNELGHLKLDKIKPLHIVEFYNSLSKDGQNKNTGGKLSPKTIRHHHILLNVMFETAVKWQMTSTNPCSRVAPPKLNKNEARYLDENGINNLMNSLEQEPIMYKTIYLLLLYTGMRRGELAGLEWEDIDFIKKEIHIIRSSIYLNKQGIISQTPKTETSNRTISVPDDMCILLKQYKLWQVEERLKLGDLWVDSKRVFTQWNGKPIHPQTITKHLANIVKKHGLPQISPHSLRHTHATLLISQNVDVTTISNRLGHADKSTTLDIYTHALKSSDASAAVCIENVIKKISREGA